METEKRIDMFSDTLALIKGTEMLDFAKTILAGADEYFFEMPASTTGKYHPDFAHGTAGLVRHTKAVALIASTLAESLDYGQDDTDALIVAAIAHDIKKKGNGGSKWTTRDHPVCAYEYVKSLPHEGLSDEIVDKIAMAVKCHMGKWGDFLPETEFQKTLQQADLLASRKWIDVTTLHPSNDVEASSKPAHPLNESAENTTDPGMAVFTFGKYKGYTISYVNYSEPSYLRWAVDNLGTSSICPMIRKYLDSLDSSANDQKGDLTHFNGL